MKELFVTIFLVILLIQMTSAYEYIVKKKDTLASIAQNRCGNKSWRQYLMYINDLSSDEDLFQGMILEIDCDLDDDEADEDNFPVDKNSKHKPKKQTQKQKQTKKQDQKQKQTKKQDQKPRREKAKKPNKHANKPNALALENEENEKVSRKEQIEKINEEKDKKENLEKLEEAMDALKDNLLSIELDIKLDDNKAKEGDQVSGQDINSLTNDQTESTTTTTTTTSSTTTTATVIEDDDAPDPFFSHWKSLLTVTDEPVILNQEIPKEPSSDSQLKLENDFHLEAGDEGYVLHNGNPTGCTGQDCLKFKISGVIEIPVSKISIEPQTTQAQGAQGQMNNQGPMMFPPRQEPPRDIRNHRIHHPPPPPPPPYPLHNNPNLPQPPPPPFVPPNFIPQANFPIF